LVIICFATTGVIADDRYVEDCERFRINEHYALSRM